MSKKPAGKGTKRTGGSVRRPRETARGETMLEQSVAAAGIAAADEAGSDQKIDPAAGASLNAEPVIAASEADAYWAAHDAEDEREEAGSEGPRDPGGETAERQPEAADADHGDLAAAAAVSPVEAIDLAALGKAAEITLPLLGEELAIEKRLITKGRIVVARTTLEKERWIEDMLQREDVEVERVTIGREIDAVPAIQEDDALIVVPVVEEVLVTHRQLVLKEEVRVRRVQEKIQHRQVMTVREQEGVVARLAPESPAPPAKAPINLVQIFVGSGFDQLTQAHAMIRSTNAWLASAIDQDRRAMQALQVRFLEASALPFAAGLHVLRAFGGLSVGRCEPGSPDRG
jgi:uncharacterized protein (TIGR02271 family)